MNKWTGTGRLVRDPEIRATQSGKMVTTFTLAVNHFSGGQQNTDYIPVVTWERLAENCGNSLRKGSAALIEGRLATRSYDGKDGQKRYVTEVIAKTVEFLDRKAAPKPTDEAITDAGQFGQDVPPEEEIPFSPQPEGV